MKKSKYVVEYTYDLFENLTDEYLRQCIDEEGFNGVYTPNDIKKYLHDEIYKLYKNATEANNENNY